MKQIFSKGDDARSYMEQDRGSSANWKDESEFATPRPDRSRPFNFNASLNRTQASMTEQRPKNTLASMFNMTQPSVPGREQDMAMQRISEEANSQPPVPPSRTQSRRPTSQTKRTLF